METPDYDTERAQSMKWEILKYLLDGISIGAVLASLIGSMPYIATFLSIVWMCIRIIETDTVKSIVARRRKRRILEE